MERWLAKMSTTNPNIDVVDLLSAKQYADYLKSLGIAIMISGGLEVES